MKRGYKPLFELSSHSVVVITLDFESNDVSSILTGSLSSHSSVGRASDCSIFNAK